MSCKHSHYPCCAHVAYDFIQVQTYSKSLLLFRYDIVCAVCQCARLLQVFCVFHRILDIQFSLLSQAFSPVTVIGALDSVTPSLQILIDFLRVNSAIFKKPFVIDASTNPVF